MARLLLLALAFLPLRALAADEIDAYVNAYYLAEGKLADFDNELAQRPGPGFLLRSKNYRELIALRILLEEKARSIAHGSAQRENFRARLDALDPVERIAVSDLLPELRAARVEAPVFFSTLAEELSARKAARSLMAARTALSRRDAALLREVKALAATLDFGRRSDEIWPLTIQPGAGPEGTVGGSQFPANTWALTFDDGPSDKYTPPIFANLAELGKKASFFWLVECLEQVPDMPVKAKALGFPTNNHSWTHENLDKAKPDVLTKEVVTSTEKDVQFYGERPHYFRLPYGAGLSNKPVRQLIADNGMIHVFWNVDSLDWKDKNPETILARVKKAMAAEKKGIILFHDIHPQSVEASKLVLKWSATLDGTPQAQRWVTIPEIVNELNRQGILGFSPKGLRSGKRVGFSLDRAGKVR